MHSAVRVDRLVERGIMRLATKDRYYLDEDALQEWHSRKRAIAFAILDYRWQASGAGLAVAVADGIIYNLQFQIV